MNTSNLWVVKTLTFYIKWLFIPTYVTEMSSLCLHRCGCHVNLPLQWSGLWNRSRRGGLGWLQMPGWSADSSCSCQRTRKDSTWGSALHGTTGRTTLWTVRLGQKTRYEEEHKETYRCVWHVLKDEKKTLEKGQRWRQKIQKKHWCLCWKNSLQQK